MAVLFNKGLSFPLLEYTTKMKSIFKAENIEHFPPRYSTGVFLENRVCSRPGAITIYYQRCIFLFASVGKKTKAELKVTFKLYVWHWLRKTITTHALIRIRPRRLIVASTLAQCFTPIRYDSLEREWCSNSLLYRRDSFVDIDFDLYGYLTPRETESGKRVLFILWLLIVPSGRVIRAVLREWYRKFGPDYRICWDMVYVEFSVVARQQRGKIRLTASSGGNK